MVLTSVDPMAPGEKGVRFRHADSYAAAEETGYASVDEARNFSAAKADGKSWTWVGDWPFLLGTAPSLRLKTHQRHGYPGTTILLKHAVTAAEGV